MDLPLEKTMVEFCESELSRAPEKSTDGELMLVIEAVLTEERVGFEVAHVVKELPVALAPPLLLLEGRDEKADAGYWCG